MVEKDATKRQGYIVPHALIRTRYFIIVMCFPGLVKRQGLASWNIKIYVTIFSILLCLFPFYPLLYPLNLFCAYFIPVSLIVPCIFLVECLNVCDDSLARHLICTGHLHSYDSKLEKRMI